MKHIYFYLLSSLSFCFVAAHAEKGSTDTTNNNNSTGSSSQTLVSATCTRVTAKASQHAVTLKFASHDNAPENKDSALIIFDRYNRSGAGVIFDVFLQDKNHSIVIPAVPAGKYFVTIQCMGLHRDRVEKVITVSAKKSKPIVLQLEQSEQFSKEKVVIPAYKPEQMSLGAVRSSH